MVLFSDIIKDVRVLAYDRSQVPIMYLKKVPNPNWLFTITGGSALITNLADSSVVDSTLTSASINDYFDKLSANINLISVAQSFGGADSDLISDIMPVSKNFTNVITLFKRYFTSSSDIWELLKMYIVKHSRYLCHCVTDEQINHVIATFVCGNERHAALWIAYFAVEKRRLAEYAQNSMDIRFTNSPEDFCEGFTDLSVARPNMDISVAIADVFHATTNDQKLLMSMDISKVGMENMFGDNGFWWRYQNYLRLMLEREFGDYSLRTPSMYQSNLILSNDSNRYAWYQNQPYTVYQFPTTLLRYGAGQPDLLSGGDLLSPAY